jgi:hypothetical protein
VFREFHPITATLHFFFRKHVFPLLIILTLGPLTVSATEAPMGNTKATLRDMLYRDFGYELKITGGFGQSRNDPIVITDSNPDIASVTEMLVLRGIGKGRGVLWKTSARTLMNHEGAQLEQVKIETKTVSGTEITTQRENYYFDVSTAIFQSESLPTASAFKHPEIELAFPYEIGWLHFDSLTDNEKLKNGLGQTIAYGAPGIKATIYVYDKGYGDILKDDNINILKNEFESSISDLMRINPGAKTLSEASNDNGFFQQRFLIGEDISIVALMLRKGKFVKLRTTFIKDPLLNDIVNETLSEFKKAIFR